MTNFQFFSDLVKYLQIYFNTNLENNRKKLLETLKDCLQKTADNRPNCSQLLEKFNEFSVDKSLLMKDNKTYEEFQTALDIQENSFLKRFFDHKINEKELSPNEPRIKRPKIDKNE